MSTNLATFCRNKVVVHCSSDLSSEEKNSYDVPYAKETINLRNASDKAPVSQPYSIYVFGHNGVTTGHFGSMF